MMKRTRPPIADPAMIAVREEARAGVEPCKDVTTGVTIVVGTPLMSVANAVVGVEGVRLLDGVENTGSVEEEDEDGGVVVEEAVGEDEETNVEVWKEEDEDEEEITSEVEVEVGVVEVEVNEEGA